MQKGIQNLIDKNLNWSAAFEINNNGPGLQSLNDLLTVDCSWLPNGVEESFLGVRHLPKPGTYRGVYTCVRKTNGISYLRYEW